MPAVGIDEAHFFGLLIGLLIYGAYLVIFSVTIYTLLGRTVRSKVVLTALFILFALSLGYYVLATYDIYRAFIPKRLDPGTVAYLNNWSNPIPPAKDIMYMLSLAVADSLLVWRLWVIWPDNKWAFAAVGVLACGMVAVAFGVSINECLQAIHGSDAYIAAAMHWTVGGSAIILTTNLLVTSLITYRLRWMGKQVEKFGPESSKIYRSIMFVMIQNGSLYFVCVIGQLLFYAIGVQNLVYIVLHISPAVVALFPTLIVLQLNLPQWWSKHIDPHALRPPVSTVLFRHEVTTSTYDDTMISSTLGGQTSTHSNGLLKPPILEKEIV